MDSVERYAAEKMMVAVDSLATGAEGIRIRLRNAFLSFAPLQTDEFTDPELRKLFTFIMTELTKTPAKGTEGSVAASLAKMTDDECVKVAEAIVKMNDILQERFFEWERGLDEQG